MTLNGQLFINGQDAWTTYGVFLAERDAGERSNYAALLTPSKMKPYPAVGLREEDGERMADTLLPRREGRDLTLTFAIVATRGGTHYLTRYRRFVALLQSGSKGWLNLYLPTLDVNLRCYYKQCSTLSPLSPIEGGSEQAALMSVVFHEPQPQF